MPATETHQEFSALQLRIKERLTRGDFRNWRGRVESVGGCLHPVHLSGEFRVEALATGSVLTERSGRVFAPCGNRRANVCPACADRYAADAFQLVRAGLCGGKGVAESVAGKPRLFVTLTAPSFGPVHSRKVLPAGKVIPCRCGETHRGDDTRLGTAVDPASYDYTGAVLWQAHAGELWHRFTVRLRRELAQAAGITVRTFPQHARISYAKVAEYQRRGLVHFHAIIRLDGPTGANDPAPAWAHPDLLTAVVQSAAAHSVVKRTLPVAEGVEQHYRFIWGEQLDVRTIAPADVENLEDRTGSITDKALAGYIAKYATKSTSSSEAAEKPIRSEADIDHIATTEHHRQMIRTAWALGGLTGMGALRMWAHMLGFRGHFLTKSKHYSTRFELLRNARKLHNWNALLDRLGVTEDEITVVNHWQHTGSGYATDTERELASAIYERKRQQRTSNHDKEDTPWNP